EVMLDEVKLKEEISKNDSIAIMLEQNDGTYKESNESIFPTNMIFNSEKSGCIDSKGNKLDNSLTFNNGLLNLRTKSSAYCYVYFDRKENGSLTLSETSGTVNKGSTHTFTVTNNASGGALSVTSGNNGIATASVSGNTITITGVLEGSTTITVTSAETSDYLASSVTYNVTVTVGNKIVSIAVTTPPSNTQQRIGRRFDSTGMVVTATYLDGTTAEVTDYTYSSISSDGFLTEEDSIITISYTENGVTKTATQLIEVGHVITITGDGYITDAGRVAKILLNGVEYTSATTLFVAHGTVISYNGWNGAFVNGIAPPDVYFGEITVTSDLSIYLRKAGTNDATAKGYVYIVSAIDFITTPPNNIHYLIDNTFNPSGMVVTHTNSDGTKEIVTDYTYSPTTALAEENTFITISYERNGQTYSTSLPIHVTTGCFAEGTLITLANGVQKPIEEITYEDELLVWDFYTGQYTSSIPSLIESSERLERRVLNLQFEDGTIVRVIDHHGFFDIQDNNFVFIDEFNVESYIGHKFVKTSEDGANSSVELVGYTVTKENVKFYTILTAIHNNCIAEGMLTLTPPPAGFDEWFDIFDINEEMKYDESQIQAEIAKYGLYTYEEFADYVTYEQFIAFNGPYLKVLVGRNIITFEKILELISTYVN
ncbi:MAG: Ig-like domain-containing protein, partial [Bacilli bacterium]|nr:Ig-like domain-containing protein [Bacilli bacterium]